MGLVLFSCVSAPQWSSRRSLSGTLPDLEEHRPKASATISPTAHVTQLSVSVHGHFTIYFLLFGDTGQHRRAGKCPIRLYPCACLQLPSTHSHRAARLEGSLQKRERSEGMSREEGDRGRGKKGGLSRQAVQSCLAMSPCHRHGNAEPADSFGLIGSCQGTDKINAARDGDTERWA